MSGNITRKTNEVGLCMPVGLSKRPTPPASSTAYMLRMKSVWIPYGLYGKAPKLQPEAQPCTLNYLRLSGLQPAHLKLLMSTRTHLVLLQALALLACHSLAGSPCL